MIKLINSGSNGYMGQVVDKVCALADDVDIVCGFSRSGVMKNSYPVYKSPCDFVGSADALIDFSNPDGLSELLEFGLKHSVPLVLCTTGYSKEQLALIDEYSKKIPILRSGNMSLGINLMCELTRHAASVLGESFDIEITERHHRRKVDAPSGTAYMIAEAAASALPYEAEYIYDRHAERKSRGKTEIGMSAIRGGTIVGEHSLIFAGENELLEIKHAAQSRDVFANGALAAARFMSGITEPALYDMGHVINKLLSK